MDDALGTIVERVRSVRAAQCVVLVGIDGPGGAGKSAIAAVLAERLQTEGFPGTVVHFDDFYLPSAERPRGDANTRPIGGDFDWQRLRDEVLVPLREGRAACFRRYDWATDALAGSQQILARGVVIVEGVYCTRQELRDRYDIRIWVDCPREERLERGVRRDGEAARSRWEQDWMPAEDRYVREHAPAGAAHFVLRGTTV